LQGAWPRFQCFKPEPDQSINDLANIFSSFRGCPTRSAICDFFKLDPRRNNDFSRPSATAGEIFWKVGQSSGKLTKVQGRDPGTQASKTNPIGRTLSEIRPVDVCGVYRKVQVRRKVGEAGTYNKVYDARRRHSTTNQLRPTRGWLNRPRPPVMMSSWRHRVANAWLSTPTEHADSREV
jgi:hypothetical protein